MQPTSDYDVLTITLNPAIDQTVTINNFHEGIVNRAEDVQQHAGGKGVNVALTLIDAGHRAAVSGFLGRDNAKLFEEVFARKQITDSFIRISGQTRVGIKIVDPALQQTTDINFSGLTPTADDVTALMDRLALFSVPWVVLAGSLPPGVDANMYGTIAAAMKERGCRIALDTSGEPLRHALEANPHIIKPNIHELETLVGHALSSTDDVISAARTLLDRGLELVVVSMGEQGALFIAPNQIVRAQPPRVTVQSTVGAGDAMVAGTIASQLRGLSLEETARLATAFSIDAISKIGAGLSDSDVIAKYMEQVTVETLS